MKILIFGGFLGSGKTTALMQLARYIVNNTVSEKKDKIMILENEIGEIGIDDKLLKKSGGFTVENLFAGCACCSAAGELVTVAGRIQKEFDPEWLVVEATGVAYPMKMKENLKEGIGLDPRISILVDASRWKRLIIPMNSLLRGQVEGADTVLVNKIDLAAPEEIETVETDITEFDSHTRILCISARESVPDQVWEQVLGMVQ